MSVELEGGEAVIEPVTDIEPTAEIPEAVEPDPVVDALKTVEPVVVPAKTAEPAKPKTMEETIRETYRKQQASDKARGPDGKFIEALKTPEPVKPVVKAEPVKPVVQVDPNIEKAPTSWKGAAQAKWNALDPEIKAEVHRREQDFHKGIEGYRQMATIGQTLDAEIRPYEAMIRGAGTNAQTVVRDFFVTAYRLQTGSPADKAAVMHEIMTNYKVDVNEVNKILTAVSEG